MNVTIQLGELVLCAPADIMRGWAPALQDQAQVVMLFRARNARQRDRGNAVVTYTFTVSRQHETYGAAQEYLDDLPRQVRNANQASNRTFTKAPMLGAPTVTLAQARASFAAEPAKGVRTTVAWTVVGVLPDEVV